MEGIAKNNFSQKPFFTDFGLDLCSSLKALGTVFIVFAALQRALKFYGFSEGTGSEEVGVVVLNNTEFRACRQLNSRWLIAESLTADG